MLAVAVLLCSHQDYSEQVFELWLLVNKQLKTSVKSNCVAELVESLSEIAI